MSIRVRERYKESVIESKTTHLHVDFCHFNHVYYVFWFSENSQILFTSIALLSAASLKTVLGNGSTVINFEWLNEDLVTTYQRPPHSNRSRSSSTKS